MPQTCRYIASVSTLLTIEPATVGSAQDAHCRLEGDYRKGTARKDPKGERSERAVLCVPLGEVTQIGGHTSHAELGTHPPWLSAGNPSESHLKKGGMEGRR